MKRTIQVPASTTNLGAGFDALGLALKLFLRVEIRESSRSRPELWLEGEGAEELPANEENLIWKVMWRVFECENQTLPRIGLRIFNEIPIARGLGSSAAAIVAGIGCFEAMTGTELSQEKFFRYALEFENHPDNITAARYGGFTISCVNESKQVTFLKSKIASELKILLIVPEFQLETEKARSVLPKNPSFHEAIFNIQHSSLTVGALLKNELHLLRESLRDKVHQPFRSPLIPGLEEILRLQGGSLPGLLGVCLSGAGPSVLALAEANLSQIYRRIEGIFEQHHIHSRSFELEVDNQGRTIS